MKSKIKQLSSLDLAKEQYNSIYKSTLFPKSRIREERFKDISKELDGLGGVKKVLDYGGGDGLLKDFISKEVDYFYVDISSKHKINKNISKPRTLLFSKSWQVPVEDDFFDVVILSEVLEHIHNPLNALFEIQRILKRNGYLIITVPNAFSFFYIILSIFGKYIEPSKEHVGMYDFSHLNNMLSTLNYKMIKHYTKYFMLGRIYANYLFWADPIISKIFPNNNIELVAVFKNAKRSSGPR